MKVIENDFTYIDLFSGIGGFRLAMESYSHKKAKCIFASEINPLARQTYELNFGDTPLGDIRGIDPINLGFNSPEVVCGGFPCQTFSKGGFQEGFKDARGTLFREIIRIITSYNFADRPKILILENVQNLIKHDNGHTWKTIYHEISQAGYNVIKEPIIISPKDVGIPQLRNRAIILGVRNDIYNGDISISVPKIKSNTLNITSILQHNLTNDELNLVKISSKQKLVLTCWDEFIHILPREKRIIGFPIWSDEFNNKRDISSLPKWKQNIILKNRSLYNEYSRDIDKWMKKWDIRRKFTKTQRKFEWQAGLNIDSVFDGIIQFRTSGIRVKRPTESPTLVAMDHRPIYGPDMRYFTPVEELRLQSFPDTFLYDENVNELYKQLGNAVNAKVIETIFSKFILFLESVTGDSYEGIK